MLFGSVGPARRLGEATRLKGVLEEGAFAGVLRRERDRADRTQGEFTLVALDLGQGQLRDPRWLRRLAGTLGTRLRSTDDAGWLPNLHLGIALPHTSEDGAWVLAHALRSELERKPLPAPLRFTMYSYSGRAGPDEPEGREPDRFHGGQAEEEGSASPKAGQARSLEPLFFQPPGPLKRSIDVVLATLGLLVTAPLMAVAGVLIKLSSPGPVLFRQERAGYGGRPFMLYKLRTMVDGAEEMKESLAEMNEVDGPVFKISKDPRVTAVGRFLRRTSIDEMPQFWNVLRGEMSIVGPRPPTLDEIESYATWQRRRLHAIGGLTCFWQVGGRSNIGFLDWVRLDLRYLRRRSIGMDLLLILRTIPAVLVGRGAK